jgi:rubrerythrin
MKKLLLIPIVLLAAGSLFIASCGNANTEATMKSPVQTTVDSTQQLNKESGEKNEKENEEKESEEKNETSSPSKPAANVPGSNAATKNTENLQAAFKGETTAAAKYAAYSKKAEQEGLHQVALLFKAASTSENIHANNHKAVLQESGIAVPVITPVFEVKSTRENLQDAIAGETYEVTTMYPDFLTTASTAGNQLAMMSLNYAYKTEKKHKLLYEAALTAVQNKTSNTLASVFYVCPTCGNTYETTAPARCGISMTAGEKFIKIISI